MMLSVQASSIMAELSKSICMHMPISNKKKKIDLTCLSIFRLIDKNGFKIAPIYFFCHIIQYVI